MADLLFTAGLDDRKFRQGLRGIGREAKNADRFFDGSMKKFLTLGLGLYGLGSLTGLPKKVLSSAIGAVADATREYAKINDEAARSLLVLEQAQTRVLQAVGRTTSALIRLGGLDIAGQSASMGVEQMLLRSLPGMMPGGPAAQAAMAAMLGKMREEEAATQRRQKQDLLRSTGGGIESDILRLQGRGGEADRLSAFHRFLEFQGRVGELERTGKLTRDEADTFRSRARLRYDLQAGEALRRDTRSFGGDVPRALREAVSGVVVDHAAKRENEKFWRATEQRAEREKVISARREQLLRKIEANTRQRRPAVMQ